MSNKTIAKISAFVIFFPLVQILSGGCSVLPSTETTAADNTSKLSAYGKPEVIGKIASDDVDESSGIAASRCQPGVLWTHNDSGDGPFIYAIDRSGANLGTWRVPNADSNDWEDIAEYKDAKGQCFVYIGDIGDNKGRRLEHTVYRISEPAVSPEDAGTNRGKARPTANAEVLKFIYPDGDQNAETLMVHPVTGDVYVLTKRIDGPSGVYKLPSVFDPANVIKASRVGEVAVPNVPNGLLTGGDISPDGTRVAVCDYSDAYELVLPVGSGSFDNIWKQKPDRIDRGKLAQGEAIGYSPDGNSLLLTSEEKHPPLVEVKRVR
jgi:hypothetical protein